MFQDWREEREIRKTLRGLARQRVAIIHRPSDVKVIERALVHTKDTDAILLTCEMRGWIEVMEKAVAHGELTPDGGLPAGPMFTSRRDVYKLTDSGWNAINRAHEWTLITTFLGFLGLLAAIAALRG